MKNLFYRAVLFSKGKEILHVLTTVWTHHAALGQAYKRYRWAVVRVEAVLQNPRTKWESIAMVWDRNWYDSRPEALEALCKLKADPAMMMWKLRDCFDGENVCKIYASKAEALRAEYNHRVDLGREAEKAEFEEMLLRLRQEREEREQLAAKRKLAREANKAKRAAEAPKQQESE